MSGILDIRLQPDSNLPLYRQIVDAVCAGIEDGTLTPDTRLPTVRDLADSTGISRGTIKHAYDELAAMGLIEMIQGRGTFVRPSDEQTSKKERATKALDRLLDELEALALTPREMRIYFDLKLREREENPDTVRVAAVDCNPEALMMFADQIAGIAHADVQRFLLDDLLRTPDKLDTSFDLVVTSYTHYDDLAAVLSLGDKLCRVALSPTQGTVADIAKLTPDKVAGMIAASEKFLSIIRRTCHALHGRPGGEKSMLFGEQAVDAFLQGLDAVIVPSEYLRLCGAEEGEALRRFRQEGGLLVPYTYRIDAGSYLYMEQRVAQVYAAAQEQR